MFTSTIDLLTKHVDKIIYILIMCILFGTTVQDRLYEKKQTPIGRPLEEIMADKYVTYPDEWDKDFKSVIIPIKESNASSRNTRTVSK